MVKAAERGTALVPLKRKDLELVFPLQYERVVARDNTVSFAGRNWQLERTKLRGTLAGWSMNIWRARFRSRLAHTWWAAIKARLWK